MHVPIFNTALIELTIFLCKIGSISINFKDENKDKNFAKNYVDFEDELFLTPSIPCT
jgi:hypothetical protein